MSNGNTVGETATNGHSPLSAALALGADVVDETLLGTVSLAQVLRTEVFGLAGAVMDLLEALSRAGFKVARETVGRVDGSTRTVLEGTGTFARSVSNALRGSGEMAAELVGRTAAPFLGSDAPKKAA